MAGPGGRGPTTCQLPGNRFTNARRVDFSLLPFSELSGLAQNLIKKVGNLPTSASKGRPSGGTKATFVIDPDH